MQLSSVVVAAVGRGGKGQASSQAPIRACAPQTYPWPPNPRPFLSEFLVFAAVIVDVVVGGGVGLHITTVPVFPQYPSRMYAYEKRERLPS